MSDFNFKLSPNFVNTVLDNFFGIPRSNFLDTKVYVGLGIEFDEANFCFTKEPVSKGFTINENPCEFNEPINGILRNKKAINWDKATEDWTSGDDKIRFIGLYYRKDSDGFEYDDKFEYELIAVLRLIPEEVVLKGETMVLNPNSIQIRLCNR